MKRSTIVAIAVCFVVSVTPFTLGRLARLRLAREQELAHQAGIPLTPADLPLPKFGPADDAAPDYLSLDQFLTRRPVSHKEQKLLRSIWQSGKRPDAGAVTSLRHFLTAHRDALAIIHRAAAKPAAAFVVNFDNVAFTIDKPVPGEALKTGTAMLRTEAIVLAADGHWEEAVRTQALGFRIASHAASAPYIIGYLIGIAMDARTISGLDDLLFWSGPNERVARAVIKAIEDNRPKYDISRSLKGEYLISRGMLRGVRKQIDTERDNEVRLPPGVNLPEALRSRNDPIGKWLYAQWESDYLYWLRRLIVAASLPLPQRQPAILKLQAQLPRGSRSPLSGLSSVMMPVLFKAPARGVQIEARRSVLLAAAHVMSMVARSGRIPDEKQPGTLTGPGQTPYALPIDPWSGNPVRYRRQNDGFVVYSVGERGNYDGRRLPYSSGEIAFRWPDTPPETHR